MILALVSMLLSASPITSPEAQRHFDLAMRHYRANDREGALLEFERARAIEPSPPVLFNVALVAAGLGRSVHALEAIEAVLAVGATLPPDRLSKAKALQRELSAKVGTLVIRAPVSGAAIDVDGHPIGTTPLSSPVRVMPGRVLVTAVAPRHAPRREEIEIVAGGTRELLVPLEPLERPLAQLKISCPLPGASVFIDGARVATTPTLATLPLVAGEHLVRISRDGYRAAEQRVSLGEGSSGELSFTLEEDATALASGSGRIEPHATESQVLISVDGQRRGVDLPGVVVPPGPHVLVFERAGFFPQRHEVMVEAGGVAQVEISFEPTPELRAELEARRGLQHRLGIGGMIGGGLIVAGGAALTFWAQGEQQRAQARLNAAVTRLNTDITCLVGPTDLECQKAETVARAELAASQSRAWFGPAALGTGAALGIAGLLTFLLAPDLGRFDAGGANDLLPMISGALGPAGGAVNGTWFF